MADPALRIHTSNRLDVLVDQLARDLGEDPLPPLEREVVVVQSQGLHRWLTLELAKRWRIAASLTVPFPRTFCHHLAEHLLDGDGWPASEDLSRAAPSPFSRELLTWRIFALLGESSASGVPAAGVPAAGVPAAGVPAAGVPAAYLEDDPDQRKRYQLAARLAALFDDYQLYRPEMMIAWETGREEAESPDPTAAGGEHAAWQAALWRRLVAEAEEDHLARRFTRLLDHLQSARPRSLRGLPRRLSVFGVATLPPVFVRLMTSLARFVPVSIYFVSPTYHYWGDLRSEREIESIHRRLRRTGKLPAAKARTVPAEDSRSGVPDDELHFEEGHPLLAALGRQGRDFFNLLQSADPAGDAWHELDFVDPGDDSTVDPGDDSTLHALQSDVLHLIDRSATGDAPPRELDPDDDSLSIHACHSPMREMEVVRDRILGAFARDDELRPSDVLVLVPDVSVYSPYVEAVFGVDHQGAPRLPYSVADRRAGVEQPPAETILQVLALVGSRLAPGPVFDLLDVPAIRRRSAIAESEIPLLRQWILDTRVRWGMDADQRGDDFDLPREEANTWRAGLDRLLMGYAAGDREELVAGIVPHAGATAAGAELLGRLACFVDTLFGQLRALQSPRSLERWADSLHRALDALYLADGEDEERALLMVRLAIDQLRSAGQWAGERAGSDEPVHLEVVHAHLEARLSDDGFGYGFLAGGITFCALKPMRTIPFKMICVAGLVEGAFPRRDPPRSFDLLAARPAPGDRSLRDDDRYLFLETLLAAGERLVLTYVGRSARDGSELAPSVVVAELLDHLDRAFVAADGTPRQHLLVEHRLQPWSPDYFDPRIPGLESYSLEAFEAAAALLGEPGEEAPFVVRAQSPRPQDGEVELDVSLDELAEFWVHPSRHYCRHVLQLYLESGRSADARLQEAEPFAVDFLAGYGLRRWLLERRLRAGPDGNDGGDGSGTGEDELALLRGMGELPLAGLGAAVYAHLGRDVREFAAGLPEHRPLGPRRIELAGGGWRLAGALHGLTDLGLLRFRLARIKPKDLVRAWVAHVAWNVWRRRREEPSASPETLVIGVERGINKTLRFQPLVEPWIVLEALIEGYRKGLDRPLPLFQEASFRFVDQRRRMADPGRRSRTSPRAAARAGWRGGEFLTGDREDPYVALCFRGRDPLAGESFASWAEYLWGPLFDAMEDVS